MHLAVTYTADALRRTVEDLRAMRDIRVQVDEQITRLELRRVDLERQIEFLKTNPEGR